MMFCANCGEEMKLWHVDIYECEECGNMIDFEGWGIDEE